MGGTEKNKNIRNCNRDLFKNKYDKWKGRDFLKWRKGSRANKEKEKHIYRDKRMIYRGHVIESKLLTN